MKIFTMILFIVLVIPLFVQGIVAQTTNTSITSISLNPANQQGLFFITPFYQFTHFKELKLTSHTNKYNLAEGRSTFEYPAEDINEYNDNFGTEYQNSMNGLKIGYQMPNGFGLGGYVGIDHYNLRTWIAPENEQRYNSDFPAITLGATLNYTTVVFDKLEVMAMADLNYSKSSSEVVNNNSNHEVISSYFHSMYWDVNLVLGYPVGRFIPFAGIGFTELYVKAIHEQQFVTTDNEEVEFLESAEFESNFKGSSFYGFVGAEYFINPNVSVYARSSFINPVRATIGFRIII